MNSAQENTMNRSIWIVSALILGVTLYLEFAFLGDYDSYWWNAIPGFYALWGLAGCAVIIYTAKWIAKKLLNRELSYYD